MKKLFIPLFLLFFVVFPKSVAFAQESSPSAAASPTAAMVTNYTLPYPGILPDNPLYFLKALRDKIVVFLISDPLRKSSFYLLQSDKRLESSWYLLKKDVKHDDLALSTLSKSTNYFSLAIDQAGKAKKSGGSVASQAGNLQEALTKHIAVIDQMLQLPGLSHKEEFVNEQTRLKNLENVVSKLSL